MSILDEIARRRRASALRRLGPPPGTLPDSFPMPARRAPTPPSHRASERERGHTLESVLPQVLASISALPARRETPAGADPIPLLERRPAKPPAPAPDPPTQRPGPATQRPEPAGPPPELLAPAPRIDAEADVDVDVDDIEEVDAEIHIPDAEPVDPVEPVTPVTPVEPVASTWARVADAWTEPSARDAPAPLEPQPEREPVRRDAPRYDPWLPTPDLFKLVSEPITGGLEPVGSTDLKPVGSTDVAPVTSTELVPVRAPAPAPEIDRSRPGEANPPNFVERTQLRRRIRYLRQLREVQLRDLGGFALELHRFGAERPELTQSKIEAAAETDRELRQLEYALNGRVELRVVREAGIGGACSSCGAVYGTEDRFCSNCGEPLPGTTLLRDDRRPQRPAE